LRRIPELDGIRGRAILLVVVFHLFIQSTTVTLHWQQSLFTRLRFGLTGVDLSLSFRDF
jgi:peptidoglycan/LPS O-acetylase OafA/YrhL